MRKLSGYGPSLVVLTTTMLVLFVGPSAVRQLTYVQTQSEVIQARQSLSGNDVLQQINQAYRDIARVVEPSVVHISAEHEVENRFGTVNLAQSSGSGWIYDENGHIVTNYHVIQDAQRIQVQLHDGGLRDAEVVGADPTTDIAVIKVPQGRLIPAQIAEAGETVNQGDQVFAFGSPFDFRFSMSSGVVSGKGRSVGVIRDPNRGRVGYENFIQVDAAINPGNSGGPLTDVRGHVIGMNTAIATGRRNALEEGQFAGIGLAIPIAMICPVVEQIINTGVVMKGYLGVNVIDRTDLVGNELIMLGFSDFGVVVSSIEEGNPGWKAGLRADDVIYGLNERPIQTIDELRRATGTLGAGETVKLTVWRFDSQSDSGRSVDIAVPGVVASGWRGVNFLEVSDTVGVKLQALQSPDRGVRVVRAELKSPARAAGVQRDDVITHVNEEAVTTVKQLQSLISSILPGESAKLNVWRYDPQSGQGRTLQISVPLGRFSDLRLTGRVPIDQSTTEIPELGIARMAASSPALARETGVDFHEGVLIQECVPGSDLSLRAGAGATIVEVMSKPVRNVEEFIAALRQYDLLRGASALVIDRDGNSGNVLLRVK